MFVFASPPSAPDDFWNTEFSRQKRTEVRQKQNSTFKAELRLLLNVKDRIIRSVWAFLSVVQLLGWHICGDIFHINMSSASHVWPFTPSIRHSRHAGVRPHTCWQQAEKEKDRQLTALAEKSKWAILRPKHWPSDHYICLKVPNQRWFTTTAKTLYNLEYSSRGCGEHSDITSQHYQHFRVAIWDQQVHILDNVSFCLWQILTFHWYLILQQRPVVKFENVKEFFWYIARIDFFF